MGNGQGSNQQKISLKALLMVPGGVSFLPTEEWVMVGSFNPRCTVNLLGISDLDLVRAHLSGNVGKTMP